MENEQHNVDKAACLANMFHFFYKAASVCLYPFLPLYLRYMGLSATYVGIIFGVHAFVAMFSASIWAQCAKFLNKKRLTMAFSLLFLILAFLSLSIMPLDTKKICQYEATHSNITTVLLKGSYITPSMNSIDTVQPTQLIEVSNKTSSPLMNVTLQADVKDDARVVNSTSPIPLPHEVTYPDTTVPPAHSTMQNTVPSVTQSGASTQTNSGLDLDLSESDIALLENLGLSRSALSKMSSDDMIEYIQNLASGGKIENGVDNSNSQQSATNWKANEYNHMGSANNGASVSRGNSGMMGNGAQQRNMMGSNNHREGIKPNSYQGRSRVYHDRNNNNAFLGRAKRDVYKYVDALSDKISTITGTPHAQNMRSFVFVLLLFLACAVFASPVEKIADDSWFEYLDILDRLEKYGHHRIWGMLGAAISPCVVVLIISNSDCLLGGMIYHMSIHFYAFTLLSMLALIIACYYPVSQYRKTLKNAYLTKGLTLLCGDMHSFSLCICMLVYGLVNALFYNLLFWRMADLDSSELPMGLAVGVASLSEVVIFGIYSSCGLCVRGLSVVGAVLIAFIALGLRLVFYSFMFSPWLVIVGESCHGISSMLLQLTAEHYPDFRVSVVAMDRSAHSMLRVLSQGLGFGIGSFLSGALYDTIGFSTLYQSAAVVCGVWCIFFSLVHCCCRRKEQVHYKKLLNNEDTDTDANESLYDEDWLDVALDKD